MPTCGDPNCKACTSYSGPCSCPGCNKTPREECYEHIKNNATKFLITLSQRDFVCFMLAMEDARAFRSKLEPTVKVVDEMILQKTMKDMFKLFIEIQNNPETSERFSTLVQKMNMGKIPMAKA